MSNMSIIRPLPVSAIAGSMTDAERMLTPSPKEVSYSSATAARTIDIDLGSAQDVGAIYLGGVSATANFTITGGLGSYTTTALGTAVVAPKSSSENPRQYLLMIDPPQSLRYIRLSANLTSGDEIGNLVVGETFQPTLGHEYGGGRAIGDTGGATRLMSGGFGIESGATFGTWEFTLGDLTTDEIEALYTMLKKVGMTKPMVVVENPDVTANLHNRIHYGLFEKISKYERLTPGETRWALQIGEWV